MLLGSLRPGCRSQTSSRGVPCSASFRCDGMLALNIPGLLGATRAALSLRADDTGIEAGDQTMQAHSSNGVREGSTQHAGTAHLELTHFARATHHDINRTCAKSHIMPTAHFLSQTKSHNVTETTGSMGIDATKGERGFKPPNSAGSLSSGGGRLRRGRFDPLPTACRGVPHAETAADRRTQGLGHTRAGRSIRQLAGRTSNAGRCSSISRFMGRVLEEPAKTSSSSEAGASKIVTAQRDHERYTCSSLERLSWIELHNSMITPSVDA